MRTNNSLIYMKLRFLTAIKRNSGSLTIKLMKMISSKTGKFPLPTVFETESMPRYYDGPLPNSNEKRDLIYLIPLINPSAKSFFGELICNHDNIDTHPLIPTQDSLD